MSSGTSRHGDVDGTRQRRYACVRAKRSVLPTAGAWALNTCSWVKCLRYTMCGATVVFRPLACTCAVLAVAASVRLLVHSTTNTTYTKHNARRRCTILEVALRLVLIAMMCQPWMRCVQLPLRAAMDFSSLEPLLQLIICQCTISKAFRPIEEI